jgi:hypothetical protein
MKYVSLVLFTIALAWTWNLVHSKSDISFETHSGIQEKLAALITDTIKAKRPTASEIIVEKIWTEVLSSEKVKAFFVYSFKDNTESGMVTSEIHGDAILERKGATAEGDDHWVLSDVHASSDAIQFDDATIVTGSSKAGEGSTAEPATNHEQQAPATTENPEAPKTEEHHE